MRGGRLFIIVGGILLIGALIVVVLMMRGMGRGLAPAPTPEATPEPTAAPKTQIVVAAQNIPRAMRITEGDNAVMLRDWPLDALPTGYIADTQAVYGRITRVDIVLGMPVLENMLTDQPGDLGAVGSDAALQIPRGKVAYALPVSRYSGVAWALRPGDHVDVLVTIPVVDLDEDFQTVLPSKKVLCAGLTQGLEGELQVACTEVPPGRIEYLPGGAVMIEGPSGAQRPRLVTQLAVQDAIVLHIGDWQTEEQEAVSPAPPPGATPTPVPETPFVVPLTLIVTTQDALVLKYAEEAGASMDLVLRSAGDTTPVTTESVTLEYIFGRFSIEQPPKLPYGITPPVWSVRPGTVGESVPLQVEGGRVGIR